MTGWKFLGTVAGDDGVRLDDVSGIYTAPAGSIWELPDDPFSLDAWTNPQPVEVKSPIPKRSSKVPFWAYDANKSRRPRKRRGQPNNQGIA